MKCNVCKVGTMKRVHNTLIECDHCGYQSKTFPQMRSGARKGIQADFDRRFQNVEVIRG